MDDQDNGQDDQSNWIDRNLGKLVIAAAVLCALALVGRALTG
jgi:hypothetical protein